MTITVIGVDGAALPPGGEALVDKATLVVGGRRHLDLHVRNGATTIELGALDKALEALAAHTAEHGPAVVLASGDPGYFGILRALRDKGIRPQVVPAPSSVARLAALVGRPWDDVTVVSAHGRGLRAALNVCRARPVVAVLTAPGAGPAELGAGLTGWRRTLVVAEDIGGDEVVSTVDAVDAAKRSWREPNVVLCLADPDAVAPRGWLAGGEPLPGTAGWALPEDDFAHRDGMVTKAEVRALALAKLAPAPGTLIWDVGAGSGSVAVECARFGAAVIAVERDPVQCVRIIANVTTHGVEVRVVEAEFLAAVHGMPQPDAIFVGGGGTKVVRAAASVGAPRMVVSLAAVDRVAPARDVLRESGYRVEGVQLSASRLADLPDGSSRLSAVNPVTVLWGGAVVIGLFAIDAEQRKLAVELSTRLGRDTVVGDGPVHQAVHRMWTKLGSAVLLMPIGAAVRTIAPMLVQDESAPAVVCVTEGFVVVLAGGSSGGANALADRIAEVLGLTMVQSSGSDNTGDTVLEQLVDQLDATVDGDIAECAAAMLDGEPIRLLNPMGFALPPMPDNVGHANGARWTIVIDDRLTAQVPDGSELLRIVPRTLVVGVGASKGVSGDEVTSVLSMLEWDFGLDLRAVRAFASIDLKAREAGVLQALEDWNFWHGQGSVGEDPPTLLTYPAETLSTVDVPNPSAVVQRETGTPSVAEAAALYAAAEMAEGRPVELVVPKAKGENVTVAAVRIKP